MQRFALLFRVEFKAGKKQGESDARPCSCVIKSRFSFISFSILICTAERFVANLVANIIVLGRFSYIWMGSHKEVSLI